MNQKEYIRGRLDAGMSAEQAWRAAERERWYVGWNYVRKVARDWQREKAAEKGNADGLSETL